MPSFKIIYQIKKYICKKPYEVTLKARRDMGPLNIFMGEVGPWSQKGREPLFYIMVWHYGMTSACYRVPNVIIDRLHTSNFLMLLSSIKV